MINLIYFFKIEPEGRVANVSRKAGASWVKKVGDRATDLATDIKNYREFVAKQRPDIYDELAKQRYILQYI